MAIDNMQYSFLSDYYDRLTNDVDYDSWSEYILSIIGRYGVKGNRLLEMACGTGNMSIRMAGKGFKVTAFDISDEMLSIAYNKMVENGLNINILSQDMTEINIKEKFDIMLCICDSINYITQVDGLRNLFVWAHNHLNENGIFIFDINSPYKLRNVIGNNVFTYNEDDIAYIWENNITDHDTVEFFLTFFVRQGKLYKRFDETHTERIYEVEDIVKYAKDAEFINIDVFEAFTYQTPKYDTERINFVLRK